MFFFVQIYTVSLSFYDHLPICKCAPFIHFKQINTISCTHLLRLLDFYAYVCIFFIMCIIIIHVLVLYPFLFLMGSIFCKFKYLGCISPKTESITGNSSKEILLFYNRKIGFIGLIRIKFNS